METTERFFQKVEKRADGCWLWTGALSNGRGAFRGDNGVTVRAVHYSVELATGRALPRRVRLIPLCKERTCVSPYHWAVEPVVGRFWSFVEKRGECLVWTGSTLKGGYGQFRPPKSRRTVLAHRFSYELVNAPIPYGQDVLHRCDNPPCVNPEHLFLGTDADNTADKIAKGRLPLGEEAANVKLSADEVRTIRRSRADALTLAGRFGVTRQTIYAIRARKSWRHL